MILTEGNLQKFFEILELPDDPHERLNVIVKLEGIFAELRHAIMEEVYPRCR